MVLDRSENAPCPPASVVFGARYRDRFCASHTYVCTCMLVYVWFSLNITHFCPDKGAWDCSMNICNQKRIILAVFMPICKSPPNPAVHAKLRLFTYQIKSQEIALHQKWGVLPAFPMHSISSGAGPPQAQ